MKSFSETWATFIPTKKEKRNRAIKAGLYFVGQVFLHLALIAAAWAMSIIALSL
ncbi:MAG: hypothetical protein KAI40_03285 [Desulfobacterales bacterium]|nr:hypothetical protein [Desulfobacterales bacterium]